MKRVTAITLVAHERERQAELLRQEAIPFTCASDVVSQEKKLAVLVEEVGEVAKAIQEGKGLREELVQVAAVAVAWLESMG